MNYSLWCLKVSDRNSQDKVRGKETLPETYLVIRPNWDCSALSHPG